MSEHDVPFDAEMQLPRCPGCPKEHVASRFAIFVGRWFHQNLDMYDFMPRKLILGTRPSLPNTTVEVLSLVISPSRILLIAQIFRSLPRRLSDRRELAILIDGLNRTLVVHGDDINIVSRVLIG